MRSSDPNDGGLRMCRWACRSYRWIRWRKCQVDRRMIVAARHLEPILRGLIRASVKAPVGKNRSSAYGQRLLDRPRRPQERD